MAPALGVEGRSGGNRASVPPQIAEFVSLWIGPLFIGALIGGSLVGGYTLLLGPAPSSTSPSSSLDAASSSVHLSSGGVLDAADSLPGLTDELGLSLTDLKHKDPAALAVEVSNQQLRELIAECEKDIVDDRKQMEELLRLAKEELEATLLDPTKVSLLTAEGVPKLLEAARATNLSQRLALAAQVPASTVNLITMAEEAAKKPPAEGGIEVWPDAEAPAKCVELLCRARQQREEYSARRQAAAAAQYHVRDVQLRAEKVGWLSGTDMEKRWADGGGSLAAVYKKLKEVGPRDIEPHLGLLDAYDWHVALDFDLKAGPPDEAARKAADEAVVAAVAAANQAKGALRDTLAELNASCGIVLPQQDWAAKHNSELLHYKSIEADASDKWCVDWQLADPSHRTRRALNLPSEEWEQSPQLGWEEGKGPLVSFLVQDSGVGREEDVRKMVEWAYRCTAGRGKGEAENPMGLRGELLVMVPGGDVGKMDRWRGTLASVAGSEESMKAAGSKFRWSVLRRHPGTPFFQGFGTLSRVARGHLLVFLTGGDGIVEGNEACARLDAMAAAFDARPRLAMVGHRMGKVAGAVGDGGDVGRVAKVVDGWEGVQGGPVPAGGKAPFSLKFAGYVSGTPTVVRSSALRVVGGVDEGEDAFGPPVAASWLLSSRLWLAGYQVALVGDEAALAIPAADSARQQQMEAVEGFPAADAVASLRLPIERHVAAMEAHRSVIEKAVKESQ